MWLLPGRHDHGGGGAAGRTTQAHRCRHRRLCHQPLPLRHLSTRARGDSPGCRPGRGRQGEHMNAAIISRREFLISTAAVGGGLAISILTSAASAGTAAATGPAEVGPWLIIGPDDSVVLRVPNPESGNGVSTFAASLIAEELQCDWKKVSIEAPSLNRDVRENNLYALVNGTASAWAGRSTTEKTMRQLQQIGASARERLRTAAARQ